MNTQHLEIAVPLRALVLAVNKPPISELFSAASLTTGAGRRARPFSTVAWPNKTSRAAEYGRHTLSHPLVVSLGAWWPSQVYPQGQPSEV